MKSIQFIKLIVSLLLLSSFVSGYAYAQSLNGHYIIQSTYGCDNGNKWCNARLSWDAGEKHPVASVEHDDPVIWKIVPVANVNNGYRIVNTFGCHNQGAWCNAELSWDGKDPHPVATIEHNDPVVWEIIPVAKIQDGYKIRSTYGCQNNNEWCNGELSWDSKEPHPIATVEHDDPVVWRIIRDESEDMSGIRSLLNRRFDNNQFSSSMTIDPKGSPCTYNGECNNQRYEGLCIKGVCDSLQRSSCGVPGRIDSSCVRSVGPEQYSGIRLCKPVYLSAKYWGDCVKNPQGTNFHKTPNVKKLGYAMDNKTAEQMSTLTIDPAGSPCKSNSECNNIYYEGRCHNNYCQAYYRESCDVSGAIGICSRQFGPTCKGVRKCNPSYLGESIWGDCECE